MIKIPNHMIELEQRFAGYVAGKRIAIVARGESMVKLNGEFIDSHDIVVRVHSPGHGNWAPEHNQHFAWDPPPFVPEVSQPFVGKRTHIYYNNWANIKNTEFIDAAIQALKDENCKFLCFQSPYNILSDPGQKIYIHGKFPCRFINMELWSYMHKELGTTPLEGTIALVDILQYNPASVFVGGMECWQSAKFGGVRPDGGGYQPNKDFEFLFNLWKNNDNFTVNPEVEALFKIHFPADETDKSVKDVQRVDDQTSHEQIDDNHEEHEEIDRSYHGLPANPWNPKYLKKKKK